MSRRFATLKRRIETRAPRAKFIIFTEGEKTERDYFHAVKSIYPSVIVDIEIIAGAGVPSTISRKASDAARFTRRLNRRDSFSRSDEFWAVFDRDEHPDVNSSIQRCRDSGVGVAFSDPCFELWMILHFEDFDRPDDRHQVQRYLEKICPDYNRQRRKTTDCQELIRNLEDAEVRAQILYLRRLEEGVPPAPPFTTVYELTRRIREMQATMSTLR